MIGIEWERRASILREHSLIAGFFLAMCGGSRVVKRHRTHTRCVELKLFVHLSWTQAEI